MHKSIGISQRKSSLERESSLYITVNEDAFKMLTNIKASDEKCEEFNHKKGIERILNKVLNREFSLADPLQRKYQLFVQKFSSMEQLKMTQIPEENEEEKKNDSINEIDQSYDKLEDLSSLNENDPKEIVNKSADEKFAPYGQTLNDKSIELPERRSFFQLFVNESTLKPKSDVNDTSFADRKTRITGTSPSSFSSPLNTSDISNNAKSSKIFSSNETRKGSIIKLMKKAKPAGSQFFNEKRFRRYTESKDFKKNPERLQRNTVYLPSTSSGFSQLFHGRKQ
mmetsp:Transcript_37348/g.36946  ORF Transcript_37348/g.36946 Transcript_37348/m.36946 type:complete len:282 (+) Transcript_37348:1446-2291(+)